MQRQNVKVLPFPTVSSGVRFGNLIFVAGQVGKDVQGNAVPGGIQPQTHQAIANIREILESLNSSLDNVLKATVYLVDKVDFAEFNRVYAEYFAGNPPARTTVGVKELMREGLLVEIEVIAHT